MNNPGLTAWEPTRWRDAAATLEGQHGSIGSYLVQLSASRFSAPHGVNRESQSAMLDQYGALTDDWDGRSRTEGHSVHAAPRGNPDQSYTADAALYGSRMYDNQVRGSGVEFARQQRFAPLHSNGGRMSSGQAADMGGPLTLQIPPVSDQPRVSPISSVPADGASLNGGNHFPNTPASLPSFRAFHEHTKRTQYTEEDEAASMLSHVSCYLCAKLKPLVREITVAVAELDGDVQSYCNKAVTRPPDIPYDSPIRAIHWILDKLKLSKDELRESQIQPQRGRLDPSSQVSTSGSAIRDAVSPNPLKRHADHWVRDDAYEPKRPRSDPQGGFQPSSGLPPRNGRLSAMDTATRDSFNHSGPISFLAHPRSSSPSSAPHGTRHLQSPSSSSYPANSLPSGRGYSADSPTPYGASHDSATSAHVADLQHQISLKSLALQTLQTEYASLLQRLQRERMKAQSIEKKTNVVDREVNELTVKNEELLEQVKALESQIEESETKREAVRTEAAREKEQWGRMLEMSGRIQAKSAEDKQRLFDEKACLAQRLALYEEEDSTQRGQISTSLTSRKDALHQGHNANQTNGRFEPTNLSRESAGTIDRTPKIDSESHKREVMLLNAHIERLRSALEEVRRHHAESETHVRGILRTHEKVDMAVELALQIQGTRAGKGVPELLMGNDSSGREGNQRHLHSAAKRTEPPSPSRSDSPISTNGLNPGTSTTGAAFSRQILRNSGVGPSLSSEDLGQAGDSVSTRIATGTHPSSLHHTIREQGAHFRPVQTQPDIQGAKDDDVWAASTSRWVESVQPISQYSNPPPQHTSITRLFDWDNGAGPGSRSPRSYHSSPGDGSEDASSSSSTKPSPDLYHTDPEIPRALHARQPVQARVGYTLPSWRPTSSLELSSSSGGSLPPPRS